MNVKEEIEKAQAADAMAKTLYSDIAHLPEHERVVIANALVFHTIMRTELSAEKKMQTLQCLNAANMFLLMTTAK